MTKQYQINITATDKDQIEKIFRLLEEEYKLEWRGHTTLVGELDDQRRKEIEQRYSKLLRIEPYD